MSHPDSTANLLRANAQRVIATSVRSWNLPVREPRISVRRRAQTPSRPTWHTELIPHWLHGFAL